jgi:hypothetical protein
MASPLSLASRALLALLALSCSRKDVESGAAPAVGSVALPASSPPSAPAAAPAPALSGLDSCLVGKWRATSVTLKLDSMSAQGGANVTLDIAPTGASVIDFGPMADVHATGPQMSFDFRYSGKATATIRSPSRGTLQSESADYAGLRVTANVKLPGAGSIPLFKDTPLTELATMGTALAGGVKGLPKAKPAASAPAASQPDTAPKGIDSNPVFASNHYTCEGSSLTLRGGEHQFEWQFSRSP